MTDSELQAWHWLLALERVPWEGSRQKADGQVRIRVSPGKLGAGSGEPLVTITASHPKLPDRRVRGAGNSLAQAAEHLHQEFWYAGVQLPFIWQPQ